MTEAEMQAAADRLGQLQRLRSELTTARQQLQAANAIPADKTFRVHLTVKGRSREWTNDEVVCDFVIDKGVVQQAAVNRVGQLQRAIVKLGGEIGA